MLNEAQYAPTTREASAGTPRLTLSLFSSELARIEGLVLAGHCDNVSGLEAVAGAIASLEHVCAVDVAMADGTEFVSIACSGLERLTRVGHHHRIYRQCLATGRLIRCGDTSLDSRAYGIPFASMLITPLSAHRDLIGVLAVYSSKAEILGDDYIVPLGTAAAICSALAPQVLEGKMRLDGSDRSADLLGADTERDSGLGNLDTSTPNRSLAESNLLTRPTVPEITSTVATVCTDDVKNLPPGIIGRKNVYDLAASAREEAIRSVLLKKPAMDLADIEGSTTVIDAAVRLLRSPVVIAAVLLLLSGVVFGSMQMLRRSAAVATKGPKPTLAVTRSGEVTKILGAPRPTRGNVVPADAQIKTGRLIQDTLPRYPQDALNRSIQGDVTAILSINERGAVDDVRVTAGDALLSNSALSSLSHWRFAPFEVNGRSIAVEVPVVVAFHITAETSSVSEYKE